MRRLRKVAIFDIDGTIFRSSLLIELVDALIQEGVLKGNVRKQYARAYARWADRKDSYEKYLDAVIDAFEANLKGVRYKDFLRVAKKVVAFHENRVYRYTRDLVRQLKKKRYYLLAISGSPKAIVQEFCKKLGFNKVYGRIYELDRRERFTGRITYRELIGDKAKILNRAVDKENLSLKYSIGVGDTESDIGFLKMVDRPICFNPNKNLLRIAQRRHWTVVIERKDVIYKL
ncbi:MAG: HAD-IB family hydrolase [Candidatus Sungiibacteriota bacterium]